MCVADSWLTYLRAFPAADAGLLEGYAVGTLPPAITKGLRQAITRARWLPISNDIPEGVDAPILKLHKLAIMNREHVFRAFDAATVEALRAALHALREPVAELLKTPWRVLTCRSWTTAPGADFGMNAWHKDGGLEAIPKIMLYSSMTGDGLGGIELRVPRARRCFRLRRRARTSRRSVSGPAGLWVLFYSSKLEHRGVAPAVPEALRIATEITIAPAREFDLEPRFLGHNARYPRQP